MTDVFNSGILALVALCLFIGFHERLMWGARIGMSILSAGLVMQTCKVLLDFQGYINAGNYALSNILIFMGVFLVFLTFIFAKGGKHGGVSIRWNFKEQTDRRSPGFGGRG